MNKIRFEQRGSAELEAIDADRITLVAPFAAAPGSRLAGALSAGQPVRLKVLRCARRQGGFTLEGRLLDATRQLRLQLAATLEPTAEGGDGAA